MIQTVEAIVDEHGAVRLLEAVHLNRQHRALLTILAEEPSGAHGTESEDAWLRAAASSDAFAFLADPAEDIYTAADGEPFRDAQ